MAEADKVVAGKKDFLATVCRGATETTGFVAQKVDTTSSFEHVAKTIPTIADRVVVRKATPRQH